MQPVTTSTLPALPQRVISRPGKLHLSREFFSQRFVPCVIYSAQNLDLTGFGLAFKRHFPQNSQVLLQQYSHQCPVFNASTAGSGYAR